MTEDSNHISTVRKHLLATLSDLRDRENPMDVDRARAIGEVASVLVATAKVEVEYLKATGQASTPFLEVPPDQQYITHGGNTASVFPSQTNGINSVTRHTLKD